MTYKPKADLNHNHVSPDHRYGCLDRPKPGEPWLPLVESNSCGHSYKASDPSCTGCKWR